MAQTAYREMHAFEDFDSRFGDTYDYFSDQSSPVSSPMSSPVSSPMSSTQSPIPSPTADDSYHFPHMTTSVEHCPDSYDGYIDDRSPVYTTLTPVDVMGLRFDEMKDVSEPCQRTQCDVQVYHNALDVYACLGGFRYSIDPNETFEKLYSHQVQSKTIPVPATEKSFAPVSYCPPPRRQTHPGSGRNRKLPRAERLWEFILRLLMDPSYNPSYIEWVDRERGMFRLVNSRQIARMWGKRKNNLDMTYEKLSRAMRYYYHRKILQPVFGKKLVYKFGPNSTGWQLTGAVNDLTAGA